MLAQFMASARFGGFEIILIIAAGMLALPVFFVVHCGLVYCCLVHARRFCRNHGFQPARWRSRPEFDQSGIKTEFTVVELDCLDLAGQRRLIRLLVWVFGIRKLLSDEKYPESLDD
jgi:hypothetical protein